MTTLVFFFLLCLVLSAFFSGAEMAFVSANKLKMRELADQGNQVAQKVMRLHQHPQNFLTTILIGNNIVNVIATVICAYVFETQFGIRNEWIVTAVMAPLIVIFGEMVPKDYGRLRSQGYLLTYGGVLSLLETILRGPVTLILKSIDFFLSPFGTVLEKSIFVSEKEFRSLIEESVTSGLIGDHEKRLIDTVMDFEKVHVESVMIPLERVSKIAITGTVAEVKEIARRSKAKMVLVYEELPSIVVGMVYVFDLLFEEKGDQALKNYLRSPVFLPRTTSIEKAFLALQEKRQSFAVVIDVTGEVIGTVPIERLIAF